tara:strand:+ start:745 stop:1062 length:318 start_codon:yes stop_codon:yes gene_type:complete
MKYLKILFLFSIILLFYSCGTVKEGFINQKKNSNDEFFVEKKSPLVLPPDYDELPIPSENGNIADNDKNKIEKLVNNEDDSKKSGNNIDENKNFEDSLLEKIKNN